jgi:hypothetical protein
MMEKGYLISIEDRHLVELSAGRRLELEVGTLPHEVRLYLGCARDTIYLSDQSIRHIVQKHGDHITNADLKLLPRILFTGMWLADDRPTHAIASLDINGTRFKAVVKVTNDRQRTYVKTLHRTSPRQTRSLLRNTNQLRPAWD